MILSWLQHLAEITYVSLNHFLFDPQPVEAGLFYFNAQAKEGADTRVASLSVAMCLKIGNSHSQVKPRYVLKSLCLRWALKDSSFVQPKLHLHAATDIARTGF